MKARDQEPVVAREGANRAGAAFVAGAPGVLGVVSVLAALDRLSRGHPDAEDVTLLVFGAAFMFLGWRLWRFTTGPRMRVAGDTLWVSRFFGSTRYRFSEIEALGRYRRLVKPSARGATGRLPFNLHLPVLVVATARGKVAEHTLPGSGGATILDALSARSGIAVQRLPDGESRPADFGQRLS
ncbi:MAG: hypothetical protein AAF447_18675 [Myxococcota bacterium]